MKRAWFFLLALSLGLNIGLLSVRGTEKKPPAPAAFGPGGPAGARPPAPDRVFQEHLDRMVEGLGLNDDQRARLKAVHDSLLPRIVAESRELEEARGDLASEYASPSMDPSRFREFARRVHDTQAVLDSLVAQAMLGEAAVLTAEQRQRYAREMPWGRRGSPAPPR